MFKLAFISFLLSCLLPIIYGLFNGSLFTNKELDISDVNVIYYLVLIFIVFAVSIKNRYCDIHIIDELKNYNYHKYTISNNYIILILLFVWLVRINYHTVFGGSPYLELIRTGRIDSGEFSFISNFYRYAYFELNFKLYGVLLGVFLLVRNYKIFYIIILSEILYGSILLSKFIIVLPIILVLIRNSNKLMYLSVRYKFLSILSILIIFSTVVVLREYVAYLRTPQEYVFNGFSHMIMSFVSRIQSVTSIYYVSKLDLIGFFDGATFCKTVGLIIPDSLFNLPAVCSNVDEPVILNIYGFTGHDIVYLDLISFWSEPFLNFGYFGVVFIFMYFYLIFLVFNSFHDVRFRLVFLTYTVVSLMMTHLSFSLFLSHLFIVTILMRLVSLVCKMRMLK